ncbi:MAG: 30S ribosomal protein S12 methylthiotransferase RimO [Bacteroidales bacterium]|nr:30S ribosomal protein S12 methylthiotransferase RimO [Bacteroidales bacterium]
MPRLQLITLGCSKNRVDSEHLLSRAEAAGWEIVPEGADLATADIDTVLINTCGFIGDAKEESINVILEAARAKEEGLIKRLLAFGCLSQRYRDELPGLIPEVDRFYALSETAQLKADLDITDPLPDVEYTGRSLTTPGHVAYLKISEGCDRRCSYCAIPLIRGPHVSVPEEVLLREASSLAAKGVKELILIAQDTTWYGLDLCGKRTLARLMRRISEIDGIEWIRLHYSYPDGFPEDVLDEMAVNPKICKYIDIPLQHSEDAVLKAMRRSVDGAQTRALVEKFREKVPGVVLRTTMMVGHPGEGEEEFEALLDFVRQYRFERLGAFQYSEEEGTWGAAHLKDAIPAEVKQERYDRLMEVQSLISEEYNISRIGSRERVLVDSFSDGVLTARSQFESPEVDGEILIGDAASLSVADPRSLIGQFVNVNIKSAGEYDLLAEIIR